jgi:hypothetical protein
MLFLVPPNVWDVTLSTLGVNRMIHSASGDGPGKAPRWEGHVSWSGRFVRFKHKRSFSCSGQQAGKGNRVFPCSDSGWAGVGGSSSSFSVGRRWRAIGEGGGGPP